MPCAQANSAVELLTACQVRRGCCFDATAALIPQFYGFTSATAGNFDGGLGVGTSKLLNSCLGLGSFAALSLLGGNPGNLALQFFCPYITISLPGFPDLTNSVRGCCEVKACYHRTGSGFVPTVNPPFPPIPPVQVKNVKITFISSYNNLLTITRSFVKFDNMFVFIDIFSFLSITT